MNKKLIGILTIIYFFSFVSDIAYSESCKDYTISSLPSRIICEDNCDLRFGPSLKYKVICKLKEGTCSKIITYEDGWYKVMVKDEIGYIQSDYLSYENVLFLDWFEDGQYLMFRDETGQNINQKFTVEDALTGKQFDLLRTGGTNHADVEPITENDAKQIINIWHGYSWKRRPVYIHIEGKVYGASMSGMPHAGLDKEPTRQYTNSNRSDNYGAGVNYDSIKNNNVDGHLDIHLLNSKTHTTNKQDINHQENIQNLIKIHNRQ